VHRLGNARPLTRLQAAQHKFFAPRWQLISKTALTSGAITEQASVITPQNVSVKPQIQAEHDCYLESTFGCWRTES